jgi:hypothetical protein
MQCEVAIHRSADPSEVEAIRVRGLHCGSKLDPMHPACEGRDHLPANRLDKAKLFEDAQLRPYCRMAAPRGFSNRVIAGEACAVPMVIEAAQKRPEHVEALGLQQPAVLAWAACTAIQRLGQDQDLATAADVIPVSLPP